jgi:hypothetical protein
MKVMCINDSWITDESYKGIRPVFGEIYTVINTEIFWDAPYYQLEELHKGTWAAASNFATISEVSETEFVRDFITEKV